jgi:hypothetical protein
MCSSLFSRLASYSQNPNKKSIENFTTEVIAYLINNDKVFRGTFLRQVIPDRRVRRGFSGATALPQQRFDHGIVDLVVSGRHRRILIEIKITAAETITNIRGRGPVIQVRKYLAYREGNVVYLTSRRVSSPEGSSSRLRHCFFDDLHRQLKLQKMRLTVPGRLFIDFMEENGMESQEPFTTADVRGAQHAFRFAKKCKTTIDEIVKEVEPEFRKSFHTRAYFTDGRFFPTQESAYAYTKNFAWRGLGRGWISIFIAPSEGELAFGVAAQVSRDSMKKLNRFLCWEEENSELYTWHPILGETDCRKIIPRVLNDLKELHRGLKRAF